tara:strand:- start:3701 stop:4408 length:708 start_codon:yes stop_codon:yes gene_type:complete
MGFKGLKMTTKFTHIVLIALVGLGLVIAQDAVAQDNPAHSHIGHIADGFRGTPNGVGLLATAIAEAEVAAKHAGIAAKNSKNLVGMKRHMNHVLHALDPEEVKELDRVGTAGNGPGAGYGVLAAARGVVLHMGFAAGSDGASDAVTTHANHVVTSAQNTVDRVLQMIGLARAIQEASSASDAAPIVEELVAISVQLTAGNDANGDGGVSWQEGEGGLDTAQIHVNIIKSSEGIEN